MDYQYFYPSSWFKHEEEKQHIPVHFTKNGNVASNLHGVHSEIDRVFDSFFKRIMPHGVAFEPWGDSGDFNLASAALLMPRLDLKATDKEYRVTIELPGVEEKDIAIDVEDGLLVISGEKKCEAKSDEDAKGYQRMERRYGSFRRVLSLPEDVTVENIAASFENGVLDIAIPRQKSKDKKRISITK